jgi:hypothetical protein
MIDYTDFEKTPADPEPRSMIETFRAIGYSIEAAVADIIDNSISAGAKNIWVNLDWKGSETWLSVKDDGTGMDNSELIQAMRPGSKNPLESRSAKDLGRFGLGLKTASFSQCRILSVLSKRENSDISFWTWDLDYVNQSGKWNLVKYMPDEEKYFKELGEIKSGTIVVWNDIDRLVKNFHSDDEKALEKFLQIMEQVKKHLAMVFHRFIESNKIKIWFQEREVAAWDPFFIDKDATQPSPEDPLCNGKVKVRGFVLPHKSKLTEDEFRLAEGPKGWNEQQGFYIYRNERLLLAGDWLGMFRKEEHFKLARIRVDLPNTMDAEWQIDIKKSVARPPLVLRDLLKAYASKVRAKAVEVYRHKGQILQRKYASMQFQPVWHEKLRHGKRFYSINREHPIITNLLDSIKDHNSEINELLRYIEETVPVPLITIKESEQPEIQGSPFEGVDQELLQKSMKMMFDRLIQNGKNSDEAKAHIMSIEPFNLFPQFLEYLN